MAMKIYIVMISVLTIIGCEGAYKEKISMNLLPNGSYLGVINTSRRSEQIYIEKCNINADENIKISIHNVDNQEMLADNPNTGIIVTIKPGASYTIYDDAVGNYKIILLSSKHKVHANIRIIPAGNHDVHDIELVTKYWPNNL